MGLSLPCPSCNPVILSKKRCAACAELIGSESKVQWSHGPLDQRNLWLAQAHAAGRVSNILHLLKPYSGIDEYVSDIDQKINNDEYQCEHQSCANDQVEVVVGDGLYGQPA